MFKKGWLLKYVKSLGVKISKWKDLPATFRKMEDDSLVTKQKKKWTFKVNVAEETVFLSFLWKLDALLGPARIHITDGYWQDKTFSMLFQNGSEVSIFFVKLNSQ